MAWQNSPLLPNRIHLEPVCVCVCVCVCVLSLSHVQLFATPRTIPHQALLSMGISWQEYWSGLGFPSLEDLLNPGIKPRSPAYQANSLPLRPQGSPVDIS